MTLTEQLKELSEHAHVASSVAELDAGGLAVADLAASLESLISTIDDLWRVLGQISVRAETIRKREAIVRAGSAKSALDLLDSVTVNLGYGHEGVMVARHLISHGLNDLLAIEHEG